MGCTPGVLVGDGKDSGVVYFTTDQRGLEFAECRWHFASALLPFDEAMNLQQITSFDLSSFPRGDNPQTFIKGKPTMALAKRQWHPAEGCLDRKLNSGIPFENFELPDFRVFQPRGHFGILGGFFVGAELALRGGEVAVGNG
jgi:hypothetical protein